MPLGATTDLSQKNLFAYHAGDTWLYDKTEENSTMTGAVSRTVMNGPDAGGHLLVRELDGDTIDDIEYRVTPEGVWLLDPFGARDAFAGIYDAYPSYLEYVSGNYTVNAVRRVSKSGDLEVDIDGDGSSERYTADLTQRFVGFEQINVMGVATEVAHFTNKTILKFTFSSTPAGGTLPRTVTITFAEDAYFASGLGLVRVRRSATESSGTYVLRPYTLNLRSATVNGVSYSKATTGVDRDVVQVVVSRNGDSASVTESVMVSTLDPSGNSLYVQPSYSGAGIANVTLNKVSATQTRMDIQFKEAKYFAAGTYPDVIQLNVCIDAGCKFPVAGSPITVNTTFQVTNDPVDEPGVAALKVLSRNALTHNVIDAEYSKALGAVVMVSSWPQSALYLYDTRTGAEKKVPLSKIPTAVSVSPNGLEAAVGHDALITWVDLSTVGLQDVATTKALNLSTKAFDLVLDGFGHVHVMPETDQWVSLHSVDIATNSESLVGWLLYAGAHGKLNPSGNALYTADNGLSPSDIDKWSLDKGIASYTGDSPYHGDYAMCGNLWMSEEGGTIYTACGNTFRSSTVAAQDMRYTGALPLGGGVYGARILSLSHSSDLNEVALIEQTWYECTVSSTDPCYHHLNLYASDTLTRTAQYSLAPVLVAGRAYGQQGVALFHGAKGAGLFMISRLADMPNPAAEYYISVVR